jgi:hypothetical protein
MTAYRKKYGNAFPKNFASKLLERNDAGDLARGRGVAGHDGRSHAWRAGVGASCGADRFLFLFILREVTALDRRFHLLQILPTSYRCCVNGHHVAIPNVSFTLSSTAAQLCSLAVDEQFRSAFASTVGGVRDLIYDPAWQLGLGADVTFYSKPTVLDLAYGDRPVSFQIFLRMRPGGSGHHRH